MNVLFWVRKSYVSANGTSQIKCTISVAGTSLDFATRLSVAPDLWRQAKQRIVGADAEYTNDALDKIRARLTEIKRDFEAKNKKYTLLQVKEAFFLNRLLVVEQEVPQETNICDDLAQIQKIRAELLALTNATREKSFFNIFIKFLKAKKLNGLMSCQIEKKHIFMFLDDLKSIKNITRNKYATFLKSVFSAMLERGIITSNPCTGIKKLPEMETKSTAFAPEHIKPLADLCKNESTEMYFFCMFIFYCFIRPAELRRLEVGQINLEKRSIEIRADQSKNKKFGTVLIPGVLAEKLKSSGFLKRPASELLFSTLKNNAKYSKNAFSERFSELVKENKYPKEYSLYCWKHTGVVEHYKLNKDLVFLQRQCRHASLDETNKYLKSFGLHQNEGLDNSPII